MPDEPQEIVIEPQPGPQDQFSECKADIAIFGGSAGPGKSWCLVFEGTRHHEVPGFTGAIFRRTSPELTGAGSVWEEAQQLYPVVGGRMREGRLDCRFPSGALIQFAHCQHEDDLRKHQSKAYCLICVDELTQFTERQFWFLLSRNRSTCGVKPYFRAATNPDKKSFLRKLVDWWIGSDGFPIPERSGVIRWLARVDEQIIWGDTKEELEEQIAKMVPDPRARPEPKSFTFIAAKLDDNPIMAEKDPGYRGRLMLMARVDRLRFEGGNWDVQEGARRFFRSEWFKYADNPPERAQRVRTWDLAGTQDGGAYTAGALWSRTGPGEFHVEHAVRGQLSPGDVEDLLKRTALVDGTSTMIGLWQDPGQAGKAQIAHLTKLLEGYTVVSKLAKESKEEYAKPVSSLVEHGHVTVVHGPWNQAWIDEHENFPEPGFKDWVDTSSLAILILTGTVAPSVGPGGGGEKKGWGV